MSVPDDLFTMVNNNHTSESVQIRPGLRVEPVYEQTLEESLTFESQLRSNDFIAILVLLLGSAIVFIANVGSNMNVVDFENQNWFGLTVGWFIVLSIIMAVLVAHMVYKPYKIDKSNGKRYVMWAIIYFVIAQVFWAIATFHAQVDGGTAGIAGYLLLAATVWLGWVCYNLNKSTIYIFLILLIWTFYLQAYTYDVNVHGWIGVRLRTL